MSTILKPLNLCVWSPSPYVSTDKLNVSDSPERWLMDDRRGGGGSSPRLRRNGRSESSGFTFTASSALLQWMLSSSLQIPKMKQVVERALPTLKQKNLRRADAQRAKPSRLVFSSTLNLLLSPPVFILISDFIPTTNRFKPAWPHTHVWPFELWAVFVSVYILSFGLLVMLILLIFPDRAILLNIIIISAAAGFSAELIDSQIWKQTYCYREAVHLFIIAQFQSVENMIILMN